MRIEHVRFTCAGLSLAGDLYLPDHDRPAPGIVCAESGVKVKEMAAAPATHLADAGFAALAIDHWGIGASEGEPRDQLFPARQVDDIRAAVSYLRRRDEVDGERIGLWGNSVGGSVVVQAAVFDRRVGCVVAQSPSMFNGWRATAKQTGSAGFAALRERLQQDHEERLTSGVGARVPWLRFGDAGDAVSQSFVDLAETYPGFRNEILLESHEHFLAWCPEQFIDRLAPTPLLIVTNGGHDSYHELDEIQLAYARAGEPKQLTILPFDAMGFYVDPGRAEALDQAVHWFDHHLRRTPLPARTQLQGQ